MSVATTPQAFPSDVADPRRLADIGKRAIAIVVEQPAGHRLVEVRDAITALGIFAGMRSLCS